MRLIDADEIKKREHDVVLANGAKHRCFDTTMLYEIPTVDAVEVVRCKDCKKYIPCQKLPIGTSKWCGLFDRATCEMNYCGWGERRERMSDLIERQAAIDALWKAMFEYEDKTEKQFQESGDLDVEDWIVHRIFVQNMNDIDRQTILNLPSADPVKHGHWIESDVGLMCSECNHYTETTYYEPFNNEFGRGWALKRPYYCGYCGAKMEVEDETC